MPNERMPAALERTENGSDMIANLLKYRARKIVVKT